MRGGEKHFRKQFRRFENTYLDFEKMIKFVEEGKIDKPSADEECRPVLDSAVLRAGIVKQYEFLFEMSWKAMRALLEKNKVDMGNNPSVRSVIEEARKEKIIASKKALNEWLSAANKRNHSVHVYNAQYPQIIINYSRRTFYPLVGALRLRLKEEL